MFVSFIIQGEAGEIVISNKKIKLCCLAVATVFTLSTVMGCGSGKQASQSGKVTPVKAMQVLQKDAPLAYEYAGQVQGKNEVKIQARVSGNVVEKMVSGGDTVQKGQPLFRIDSRQYESSLLSAQAELAKSAANLSNSQLDTQRYRELLAGNAIAEQQVTTQESVERQNEAVVNSNRALVQKAQDDLNDTVVVAPIDGRIGVNDVSVGTYAQGGSTTLATISSMDPVFVQFSMSENEYLKLVALYQDGGLSKDTWGSNVTLSLSNGQAYPIAGRIEQMDNSLANNSGTLTFKAAFGNPDGMLIPGMFARVKISGEVAKNAILIPQRAVQQLLDKTFVITVDEENKAKSKAVVLGEKVGSYYIVKEGLSATDVVIVEGLTKIQDGIALDPTMVTPEEMQLKLN